MGKRGAFSPQNPAPREGMGSIHGQIWGGAPPPPSPSLNTKGWPCPESGYDLVLEIYLFLLSVVYQIDGLGAAVTLLVVV